MSNLSSSVKFDVLRGWPGSAIDETFAVKSGVTVKEGEMVVLSATGLDQPAAVAVQGAATGPTKLRMVIQGNDQFDGIFTKKAVTIRGNFTVVTEKFVAGAYTVGELVTISVAAGSKGHFAKRTAANEQVVGEVEAYDSAAGTLTVSVSI